MGLVRTDYVYGNISLLHGIAENTVIPILKEKYATMLERIISYVCLRSIQPLPMQSVHYLDEKTHLCLVIDVGVSPDSQSMMLSLLLEDKCVNVI